MTKFNKKMICCFVLLTLLACDSQAVQATPLSRVSTFERQLNPDIEEVIIEDKLEVIKEEQPVAVESEPPVVTETKTAGVTETKAPVVVETKPPVTVEKKPVITTEEKVSTSSVPFSTVEEKDSTKEVGYQAVKSEGQNGVREIVEVLTYQDGKEISRTVKSDRIIKAAVNRVVIIGTKQPVVETAPANFAQEIIRLTNVERAAAGLPALSYDPALDAGTNLRAQEIVTTWSHTRPNGKSFSTAFNISFRTMGENIAMGQCTPAEVMSAWMNSPGHKANILHSGYTKIGVSVHVANGIHYWVMVLYG